MTQHFQIVYKTQSSDLSYILGGSKMTISFIKKEMAELTELLPRRVQFYTEYVGIIPDIADAKTRGSNRKYSRENVFEFLLVKELSKQGLSLAIIKKIIKQLVECKRRGQDWFKRIMGKIPAKEICYCFVYDPFDSEKCDVGFQFKGIGVGHLSKVDGSPMDIEEYTRESKGVKVTLILNISRILEGIVRSAPV